MREQTALTKEMAMICNDGLQKSFGAEACHNLPVWPWPGPLEDEGAIGRWCSVLEKARKAVCTVALPCLFQFYIT